MHLLDLPTDILLQIVKYITGEDLLSFYEASQSISAIIDDFPNLWKKRCFRETDKRALYQIGRVCNPHLHGISSQTWKRVYSFMVAPRNYFPKKYHVVKWLVPEYKQSYTQVVGINIHGKYTFILMIETVDFEQRKNFIVLDETFRIVKKKYNHSLPAADCSVGCSQRTVVPTYLADAIPQSEHFGKTPMDCTPTCCLLYAGCLFVSTDTGQLVVYGRRRKRPIVTIPIECPDVTGFGIAQTGTELICTFYSDCCVSRLSLHLK